MSELRAIGHVGNRYGSLDVKEEDGKYFWAVGDYDGHTWDEIPEYLFAALNRYQDELEEAHAKKPKLICIVMQIQNGKLRQVSYETPSYDCDPKDITTVVRSVWLPPSPYYLEGRRYQVSMLKPNDLSDEEIQAQARKLIEEKIKIEEASLPPCPF